AGRGDRRRGIDQPGLVRLWRRDARAKPHCHPGCSRAEHYVVVRNTLSARSRWHGADTDVASGGMSSSNPQSSFNVVIAGGGVAALEGALALRDLAGDRVSTTLLAPEPEFVYRPMRVREPFAYSEAQRYSLEEIARDIGVELVQ